MRIKGNRQYKNIIFSVLFFILCVFSAQEIKASGTMEVHFIDVGQGLSILVESDGQILLYDGGDRSHSSQVVSYLKNQEITDIDYLISSHYDEDHVAGLVGCLNAFNVINVIGSDYVQDTQIYQSFVNGVDEQGLLIQHPKVGEEFLFGSGKFTILAPKMITNNDNDNSVAIKLENGNNVFIFTGDAEANSEQAMCNSGIELSCDVLVLGHHGSATATTWDLLQNTVPEYAVISCGTNNRYGHPHQDTMDKLESMDIEVYRTDMQGNITAVSNGDDITWNQEPCNDYSSGDDEGEGITIQATEENNTISQSSQNSSSVWISQTGSKYHNKPDCGSMNPDKAIQMSISEAEAGGYEACSKCF